MRRWLMILVLALFAVAGGTMGFGMTTDSPVQVAGLDVDVCLQDSGGGGTTSGG